MSFVQSEFYEDWMQKEGIPIHQEMYGIKDITELPRRPWARTGGLGTFVELEATKQARELIYVAEIPAGGALEPEKHLYDELIYILRGRGLMEVWRTGQAKATFEWGAGSLFAVPLNAWHRLVNGSQEPVIMMGVSNAPVLMNAFRNTEFIFNCDYNFPDFTGKADYFLPGEKRFKEAGSGGLNFWETNFIPDMRTARLDDQPAKVEGGQVTSFKMGAWNGAHAAQWPSGVYMKAHYHGPGAVILILEGEGYALLWHRLYGIHPYQDGHGDKVTRFDWKPGSIYSPQNEWFHQHFNTGNEPTRSLRWTGGGSGVEIPTLRKQAVGYFSLRDGGSEIYYDDEDPEIRKVFQEELQSKGTKFVMSPVTYRADTFRESF